MIIFSRLIISRVIFVFFFFNDTATTEIYTLSLHDALPISRRGRAAGEGEQPARADRGEPARRGRRGRGARQRPARMRRGARSEEHTSELQSRLHLVCRLLLEKKKKKKKRNMYTHLNETNEN